MSRNMLVSAYLQFDRFNFRELPAGDFELRFYDGGLSTLAFILTRIEVDKLIVAGEQAVQGQILHTEACAKVPSAFRKVRPSVAVPLPAHRPGFNGNYPPTDKDLRERRAAERHGGYDEHDQT